MAYDNNDMPDSTNENDVHITKEIINIDEGSAEMENVDNINANGAENDPEMDDQHDPAELFQQNDGMQNVQMEEDDMDNGQPEADLNDVHAQPPEAHEHQLEPVAPVMNAIHLAVQQILADHLLPVHEQLQHTQNIVTDLEQELENVGQIHQQHLQIIRHLQQEIANLNGILGNFQPNI